MCGVSGCKKLFLYSASLRKHLLGCHTSLFSSTNDVDQSEYFIKLSTTAPCQLKTEIESNSFKNESKQIRNSFNNVQQNEFSLNMNIPPNSNQINIKERNFGLPFFYQNVRQKSDSTPCGYFPFINPIPQLSSSFPFTCTKYLHIF